MFSGNENDVYWKQEKKNIGIVQRKRKCKCECLHRNFVNLLILKLNPDTLSTIPYERLKKTIK